MKTQFISGYFSGLKMHSPYLWEASVSRLLQDDTSRELGVAVVLEHASQRTSFVLLLDLFRQGHVQAVAFSRLAWQAEPDNIPQVLVEEVLATLVNSEEDKALRVAIQLAHRTSLTGRTPGSCDETLVFRLLSADQFFRQDPETMTEYDWHVVAEGFCETIPRARARAFVGHSFSPGAPMEHTFIESPGSIADEIVRAHPDEAWSMVSSFWSRTKRIALASWLGDEFGLRATASWGNQTF